MPPAGTGPIGIDDFLHVGDYAALVVHWYSSEEGSPPTVSGMSSLGGVGIPYADGVSGADLYAAVATVDGSRFDQGWLVTPGVDSGYATYWMPVFGGYLDDHRWAVHMTSPLFGSATADAVNIPTEGGAVVQHFLFGEENYDSLMYTIFDEDANEYSAAPANFEGTWALGVGYDFAGPGDSHSISTDYPATASMSFGFYPDGPGDHYGDEGAPACPLRWAGP